MQNPVRFQDPVTIYPHACLVLICSSSDHRLSRQIALEACLETDLTELILK